MAPRRFPLLPPHNSGKQKTNRVYLKVVLKMGAGQSHGECRIKNALEEAMEKLDNEVIEEMGENPNGTHHHLCCQWLDLTNSVVI